MPKPTRHTTIRMQKKQMPDMPALPAVNLFFSAFSPELLPESGAGVLGTPGRRALGNSP